MQAVIYGRYAENRGRGAAILERQIIRQKEFAQDHGYHVTKIYKDFGSNGHTLDRAGLKQLRKEAAHRDFEAVLVQDVPILSRNAQHLIKLIAEFRKFNISFVFTDYPYTRTFQNN